MSTAVVCDTTGYLPDELVEREGIHLVSLYVTIAGSPQERESEVEDYAEFFQRLRDSGEGVTTSQPSVGDFLTVYEPLLQAGHEIVSLHISAGISGTFDTAGQARQRMIDEGKGGERIRVYDSASSAGGLGLLALVASKAAAGGADGAAVMERVEAAREDLKIWFAIDTLDYLRLGGRVGAAGHWLGSTLKIKPILTLTTEIKPIERVRTQRRAREKLFEYAEQLHRDGIDAWVVQHIQDPEGVAELAAKVKELFGTDPVFISELGPVLGSHTGPGLLGVGGIRSEFLQ